MRAKQKVVRIELPEMFKPYMDHSVLEKGRELILIDLWQQGQVAWARDELIKHNIKLVSKMARKYSGAGREEFYLDLFNQGMMGLMTAIDKFDIQSGFKLSTYSMQWIRQSIVRYMMEGHVDQFMRYPVHIGRAMQVSRAALRQANTVVDSVDAIDIISAYVKEKNLNESCLTRTSIRSAIKLMCGSIRGFDELIVEGDDGKPMDFLDHHDHIADEDGNALNVDPEAFNKYVNTYLGVIKPRISEIIRMRYFEDQTLEECGQHFGLTRERIRQLQNDGLSKLRFYVDLADVHFDDFITEDNKG